MKDFTSIIPIRDGLTAQFDFSTFHSTSGVSYFVSVLESNNLSYGFTMTQGRNKLWKIIDAPKLPQWIMEIELLLQEAILQNINA